MGRLIPSALYSFRKSEDEANIEYLRALKQNSDNSINPEAEWTGIAARIRQVDCYGAWSCALSQMIAAKA